MSVLTPPPAAKKPKQRKRLPTAVVALIVFGLVVGALVAAIGKPQLASWFARLGGDEVRQVHFAANQFLLADTSKVKLAGVDSGVVDSVEPAPDGGAIVTLVVDEALVEAAGDTPSARLRPTTLLSGLFYVEIVPGGDKTEEWTQDIPVDRTRLPTEVDDVAERLQPDALEGAKAAVTQLDTTLGEAGGNEELHALLADAPGTLVPAGGALDALRGTRPDVDLPALVTNLQKTSAVLTKQDGQLDAIIATLKDTSGVFADTAQPVADAIGMLPATLDTTDAGLTRLDGSLDRLKDTAGPARPAVQELDGLLERAEPVLADARPLVADLRTALQDTRPLVGDLVPTSEGATRVLDDVEGPVLDRLNGPVRDALYSGYQGVGPYQYTQGDNPFYTEIGYMFTGLAKAGAYTDPNGHAVAFHPGPGIGTVSGPVSLEAMYQQLFHGTGER
ncbi:mammalian cell entry protein [Pseudonocardia pini]|uniref:mammalian cell entry protein n=1 Tax=Pseudonocardia pini TaxID=2758030 RepID=UPI0015EFFEB5|nr:mammalian cell entry protein [Pseudonocardia pini]